MADFEKTIGRATIAIPLIHVVTCGLYVAGYSAGFGGNIGGMFSASDFFTVTIQRLISTYVLSLGFPVCIILIRHRIGYSYAADQAVLEKDPVSKARLILSHKRLVKASIIAGAALSIMMIMIFICQIWTGARLDYYTTLSGLSVLMLPAWWYIADRLRFYGLSVELAWCILVFAVGVTGLGLNSGELDRRLPYSDLAKGRMQCRDQIVVSTIGERFISVSPDNRRHLINDKCENQFDFSATSIIPKNSLFELILIKVAARGPLK